MSAQLKQLTKAQQKLFDIIQEYVAKGERCPTSSEVVDKHALRKPISELAYLGYCRIEIYHQNFRVVTLLYGEQKGRSTLRPEEGKPYRILDINGDSMAARRYKPREPVTLGKKPPWEL